MEKNTNYANILSAVANIQDNIAQNMSSFLRIGLQFSGIYDAIGRISSTLYSAEFVDASRQCSKILWPALEDVVAKIDTAGITQSLSTTMGPILHAASVSYIEEYSNMLSRLTQLSGVFSVLTETAFPANVQSIPPVVIPEETMESIRKLEPLVPEKERESFEEIVAPSQTGEGNLLTFEKFCALISLIASIVTIIYYSYDFSLKVAESKQQQAEEDRLQKIVDLREAELELAHDFFEYVKENGISLPGQTGSFVEQVDPSGEQADELVDLGETDRHPDEQNHGENVHDPQE